MPRIILRIELTPAARQHFDAAVDRMGMTQVESISRLIWWLSVQHEGLQAAVLSQYPAEIQADIARLLLPQIGYEATPHPEIPAPRP